MNMQSFATALVVATFIETTLLMVLKLRQRNPKVEKVGSAAFNILYFRFMV